jgi:hypothetical protein
MAQAFVKYAGGGARRRLGYLTGTSNVTFFKALTDAGKELVRIDGRKVKGDDAFNAEGKTENQTDQYDRHEAPVTIDELLLEDLKAGGFLSRKIRGGKCYQRKSRQRFGNMSHSQVWI